MLFKAFSNLDDLKAENKLGPRQVKLLLRDAMDDLDDQGTFDCVVDTMTLHSCYDREALANQMKRSCKPGGTILLLERGQSYFPPFNQWMSFKAAELLLDKGTVEHLDMDKVVEDCFSDIRILHKERKNLGMTYIYILKNEPISGDDNLEADESEPSMRRS